MRASTFLLLGALPLLAAAGCASAKVPARPDDQAAPADAADLGAMVPLDTGPGRSDVDAAGRAPVDLSPDRPADTGPGERSPCLGKTCDDKLHCTIDTCQGGLCKSTLKAGYCLIAGVCRANGTSNPANACQRCDAAKAKTAWWKAPDGVACASDGLGCTVDTCKGGACQHSLKPGFCTIAGVCRAQGAMKPGAACQQCLPGKSNSAWSQAADGAACAADAFTCTKDICQSGDCTHPLEGGRCKIGGVCYTAGAAHPVAPCQRCYPASSATAWSPAPNGTSCNPDPFYCTKDICQGGGCTHPVLAGSCLIGGSCYNHGTANPYGACSICSSTRSSTSWTAVSYSGCCNGQQLWYCESGTLRTLDCSLNPSCGWDFLLGYYDCGTSGASGSTPKGC